MHDATDGRDAGGPAAAGTAIGDPGLGGPGTGSQAGTDEPEALHRTGLSAAALLAIAREEQPRAAGSRVARSLADHEQALRNARSRGDIPALEAAVEAALQDYPLRVNFLSAWCNLPADGGDPAGSLARWTALQAHPKLAFAPIFIAAYAAETGDPERAAATAETALRDIPPTWDAVALCLRLFRKPGLASAWAEAFRRGCDLARDAAGAEQAGRVQALRGALAAAQPDLDDAALARALGRPADFDLVLRGDLADRAAVSANPRLYRAALGPALAAEPALAARLGLDAIAALYPEGAVPPAIVRHVAGSADIRRLDTYAQALKWLATVGAHDEARALLLRLAGQVQRPDQGAARLTTAQRIAVLQAGLLSGTHEELEQLFDIWSDDLSTNAEALAVMARNAEMVGLPEVAVTRALLSVVFKRTSPGAWYGAIEVMRRQKYNAGIQILLKGAAQAAVKSRALTQAQLKALAHMMPPPDALARLQHLTRGSEDHAAILATAELEALEIESAEARLGALLAADPSERRWADVAQFHARQLHFSRWRAHVATAPDYFPQEGDAVTIERLRLAMEEGRFDDVSALLDRRRAAGPLPAEFLRLAAKAESAQGRFDAAAALLAGAGEGGRLDANTTLDRVIALLQAGRFAEGKAAVAAAIRTFPFDARFRIKAAQLAEREGDAEAALAQWRDALHLDPRNLHALTGILRAHYEQGRFAAIAGTLAAHEGESPGRNWVHAFRALLAAEEGRHRLVRVEMQSLRFKFLRALVQHRASMASGAPRIVLDGREYPLHPGSVRHRAVAQFDALHDALIESDTLCVIGNSPNILGRGLGPRIDGMQTIWRINDFRVAGYEADVGSRTDLWFTSANRLCNVSAGDLDGVRALVYQPVATHIPEYEGFLAGRLGIRRPLEGTFLHPVAHRVSEQCLYPKPTSGMRTLLLALGMVSDATRIAAAGFDFFTESPLHYFDQGLRVQVGEVHAIRFERAFFDRVLVGSGLIERL